MIPEKLKNEPDSKSECYKACVRLAVACPTQNSSCRYWIRYEPEYNCTWATVQKNNDMTLREVADRLEISFVRVKQIQDKALKKISHLLKDQAI